MASPYTPATHHWHGGKEQQVFVRCVGTMITLLRFTYQMPYYLYNSVPFLVLVEMFHIRVIAT